MSAAEPYVPRDEAEILDEALSLLPPGWLLPRTRNSMIAAVLTAWADGLAEVERRAAAFLDEVDPRTATDTIDDWERVLGRDPCGVDPTTLSLQQRRTLAHQRWTARGGASIGYFVRLAEALGYDVTITEPRPFECGVSECGDTSVPVANAIAPLLDGDGATIDDEDGVPLEAAAAVYPRWEIGPEDLRFCWVMTVLSAPLVWFRTGGDGGECGVDPMVRFDAAADLECYVRRRKPAHTDLTFSYGNAA